MELGNVKLTWTEIGTLYGKRLFLCDQIVKSMPFGETSNYETSDVRRWLNGEFLESFSDEEKSKLEPLSVNDRGDKISLLSKEEYTRFCGNIRNIEDDWWLRSAFYDNDTVYIIYSNELNFNSSGIRSGVRPACLMN